MITLTDVSLSYSAGSRNHVQALRSVDLTVAKGETLSLVGPSGSGKSSLMMVIAGLERATSGKTEINGLDITQLDEDRLATFRRDNVGIVFQSFHLIPTMTAIENVAIPLEFAGRADAFDCAHNQLAAVGLAERERHYPSELSGGEQQRVALARAFVTEPALLLADEPTGNLDQQTGAQVIDLLFALQVRRQSTLLLITHDEQLARRCSRRVRLESGAVTADEVVHAASSSGTITTNSEQ